MYSFGHLRLRRSVAACKGAQSDTLWCLLTLVVFSKIIHGGQLIALSGFRSTLRVSGASGPTWFVWIFGSNKNVLLRIGEIDEGGTLSLIETKYVRSLLLVLFQPYQQIRILNTPPCFEQTSFAKRRMIRLWALVVPVLYLRLYKHLGLDRSVEGLRHKFEWTIIPVKELNRAQTTLWSFLRVVSCRDY